MSVNAQLLSSGTRLSLQPMLNINLQVTDFEKNGTSLVIQKILLLTNLTKCSNSNKLSFMSPDVGKVNFHDKLVAV